MYIISTWESKGKQCSKSSLGCLLGYKYVNVHFNLTNEARCAVVNLILYLEETTNFARRFESNIIRLKTKLHVQIPIHFRIHWLSCARMF